MSVNGAYPLSSDMEHKLCRMMFHDKKLWQQWLAPALARSAFAGNLELFMALLGAGANINSWSVLGDAAYGGNVRIVERVLAEAPKRLKARKSLVNAMFGKEGERASPLMRAAASGADTADVVVKLLGAGADPFLPDENKSTAVHDAAERGHRGVLSALLDGQCAEKVDSKMNCGLTPLFLASAAGHVDSVSLLLDAGADKDALTDQGFSSLYQAAYMGNISVVVKLVAAGANLGYRPEVRCHARLRGLYVLQGLGVPSCLGQAACVGDIDMVELLLKHITYPAEIAMVANGATALHHSVSTSLDNSAVIQMLVQNGADVNAVSPGGDSALHVACTHSFAPPENTSTLLQAGACVNAALMESKETPLFMACRIGSVSKVTVLLDAGADQHRQNADGKTPADVAGAWGGTHDGIEEIRWRLSTAGDCCQRRAKFNNSREEAKGNPSKLSGADLKGGCGSTDG